MRTLSMAIVTVAMVSGLAACGSSSSSSSAPPTTTPATTASTPPTTPATSAAPAAAGNGLTDPAAAKKAITAVYSKFFGLPPSKAPGSVEDGPQLSKAFKVALKIKAQSGGGAEKAKVDTIKITSATTATLTYDLSIAGKVVLPGADGAATFQGGKWKVAKATFCGLIQLQYTKPLPHC